ncbi:MAG TPA: DUF4160 domain-containing protein [Longimicrobiales bacterium]|nr:DUF4160 domain-containing protein [Longimicrobiales bacterium]
MPEISRFFGIVIQMYYQDHHPPHFHVRYGAERASIAIGDLAILSGRLNPRALGLVIEWASLHRTELLEAWQRARVKQEPGSIAPLR